MNVSRESTRAYEPGRTFVKETFIYGTERDHSVDLLACVSTSDVL